jgi:hypothetical protein
MQFKDDQIHIRILNNNQICRLLEEPDPSGAILAAGLATRLSPKPFACADLGYVEIQASVRPYRAFLGMKINDECAAASELVWESFATAGAWAEINDVHQMLTDSVELSQVQVPPSAPWLSIAFFPDVYQRLTPEQRLIAVSLLWGRSYSIRKQVQTSALLN